MSPALITAEWRLILARGIHNSLNHKVNEITQLNCCSTSVLEKDPNFLA